MTSRKSCIVSYLILNKLYTIYNVHIKLYIIYILRPETEIGQTSEMPELMTKFPRPSGYFLLFRISPGQI